MASFDTSKSQRRAADILSIPYDINDSYETLGHRLEEAGVAADGIPGGHTWRTAAKLNDADLVAQLRKTFAAEHSGVESLRAAYGD